MRRLYNELIARGSGSAVKAAGAFAEMKKEMDPGLLREKRGRPKQREKKKPGANIHNNLKATTKF